MSRKLYKTWHRMKSRCCNPNDKDYKHYGARGINVCPEWLNNFKLFEIWALNNGFNENLTLDRINVNGDYTPNNCRWATWIQQQRNKRNNHYITYNGITKCLSEWTEELGLDYHRTKQRLNMGVPIERAFFPDTFVRKQNEKGQFVWVENK